MQLPRIPRVLPKLQRWLSRHSEAIQEVSDEGLVFAGDLLLVVGGVWLCLYLGGIGVQLTFHVHHLSALRCLGVSVVAVCVRSGWELLQALY